MTETTQSEDLDDGPDSQPSTAASDSAAAGEGAGSDEPKQHDDGKRAWGPLRAWRAIRSRWWSRLLSEALILGLVFWGIMAFQTRHLIDDGALAPDISLQSLDGELHNLSDYRGKKVLLAFWAPWCTVCGYEASNWDSVQEDMDVVVLSVALSYETTDDVRAFVDEHDVQVPVLLGSPNLAETYAIDTFPTMYILDEEGRVEDSVVGYTTTVGLKGRLAF